MNKKTLENFITKYSLGGEIETVLWFNDNGKLTTKLITPDKTARGVVVMQNEEFNNEFTNEIKDHYVGIGDTNVLRKMLSVLSDDIKVNTNDHQGIISSIVFSDNENKIKYTTCEEFIVPKVSDLKVMPKFELEFGISDSFLDKFSKAYNSIKSSEEVTFTIISDGMVANAILGYSKTINRNQVYLPLTVESENGLREKVELTFNAKIFMEILKANKGYDKVSFLLSSEGLIEISFEDNEVTSKYYIVFTK